MDEISLYESINENQMLSNLALAMQSNGRTVRQLKQSQSTSLFIDNGWAINNEWAINNRWVINNKWAITM
jgi:hypothetical protein